jgi:serine/threonine-protein kinase
MPVNRLSAGDVFATDFVINSVIGSGSMGIVYRAARKSVGDEVALKLMHPVLARDPKSVHRFAREARALIAVNSRHVARVLDTGHDELTEQPWLAMEIAQGVQLQQYVAECEPLSPAIAVDLLHQLFAALAAAHSAGVVHRDLKPENIFVHAGETPPLVRVLDFGIAKSLGSETAFSTTPGQGTPLWTAPEHSRADDVPHPHADIWALGLLTFYILTGKIYWKHVHGQVNMVQLSMELMRSPIAPARQRAIELGVGDRLPDDFDEWFEHCVNRDPNERFDNAGAALRALLITLNRRGRPRHRLWLPVYSDAFAGGVGITHDVSDNGMLLLTRALHSVGDSLELRFTVPPGEGEVYTARAHVVRVGQNPDDPQGIWRHTAAVTFQQPYTQLEPLLAALARDLRLPG